jgi:spermidine/putrescine transport system ATP-binding protein
MSSERGAVEIVDVTKRFGSTVAVDNVSIEVLPGEFLSLLGPSGCGKTTTLRLLAGFEQPDEGFIRISGDYVQGVPPYRRDVNTVFQHYALFPHMTVAENVAYGLRQKRTSKAEVGRRVSEALEMVKMTKLAKRKPRQMSGGQQQRVALARALVNKPSVLLLDEPLGALDRKLRQEMQIELKLLQNQLGITFVFVTHDQEEALSMSDRIAVMLDGRVEQLGGPNEIYEHPASAFVAGFIGQNNFLDGILSGDSQLDADGVTVVARYEGPGTVAGQPGLAAVRPEAITITGNEPTPGPNQLEGTLAGISHLGDVIQYVVLSETREILVRLPRHNAPQLVAGQPVWCSWPPELVQLFPHDHAELVRSADPMDEIVPAAT